MAALAAIITSGDRTPAKAASAARIEVVVVETTTGAYKFRTEIADTQELRERGLMFRHQLPSDHAMLFDWGRSQMATMWMRNTYISLDMIFILSDGTVESIAQGTVPRSLEIVSSHGQVSAVLEVAAGTAERIGLRPGDRVTHAIFTSK